MSTQDAKPATIVIQTRIKADTDDAFAAWLRRMSAVVASQPGFDKETVMPPSPPAQVDWVILQRFASRDAAVTWLRSGERQRLLAEAQAMIAGPDDVHLIADSGPGALPAPVSVVISTRIKPGQEDAFRAWDRRIKAAQAKSLGFQGYRVEAPIPGVQDDWLTILRFDSEANLQAWLDSPERRKLLEESEAFTDACRVRVARTGFDQWFDVPGTPPPAWKQNMLVLLALYPLVFLLNDWFQKPILVGVFHLPYWLFLFINIAVSVVLLSLILPWVGRRFGWWLNPAGDETTKRDLAGLLLVIGFYALWLLAFWQYQARFGLPF